MHFGRGRMFVQYAARENLADGETGLRPASISGA